MRKQVLAAILLASAASGAVYAQTNARSATAPVAERALVCA
jgi:hypothetical protein